MVKSPEDRLRGAAKLRDKTGTYVLLDDLDWLLAEVALLRAALENLSEDAAVLEAQDLLLHDLGARLGAMLLGFGGGHNHLDDIRAVLAGDASEFGTSGAEKSDRTEPAGDAREDREGNNGGDTASKAISFPVAPPGARHVDCLIPFALWGMRALQRRASSTASSPPVEKP